MVALYFVPVVAVVDRCSLLPVGCFWFLILLLLLLVVVFDFAAITVNCYCYCYLSFVVHLL